MAIEKVEPQVENLGFFKTLFRNERQGTLRFLERHGDRLNEFISIYKPEKMEIDNFHAIWEVGFGENGYLVGDRSEADVNRDKVLLRNAYFLAAYGHGYYNEDHGIQHRGTGERFINHPLLSALWYAIYYKPFAWVIAGMENHDVTEDSFLTLEDIRDFLGPREATFVDSLVKVKKTQRETDRVQTTLKLLKPFVKNIPQLIPIVIGKSIERYHNIKTLEGKPAPDRLAIAQDTFELIVPFARMLGAHEFADPMEDDCYEILAANLYGVDYVNNLKTYRKEYLKTVDTDLLKNFVADITSMYPVTDIEVKIPGIYELANTMEGRSEEVLANPDNYFTKLIMVLDDNAIEEKAKLLSTTQEQVTSEIAYTNLSAEVVHRINSSRRFSSAPTVGYTANIDKAKQTKVVELGKREHLSYHLLDNHNGRKTPVEIEVYRKSDYDWENTPLTYLNAMALSKKDTSSGISQFDRELLEKRRALAILKFENLVQEIRILRRELGDEEFVKVVFRTLADSIVVVGEKRKRTGEVKEYKRRPISRGATVLDYAMEVLPGSWYRVKEAYINGVLVELSKELNNGDTIHLEESGSKTNNVDIDWLDAVNLDQDDKRRLVLDKLLDRISQLNRLSKDESLTNYERDKYVQKEQELKDALTERGRKKFEPLVPHLFDFGSVEGVLSKVGVLPSGEDYKGFLYLVETEQYSEEHIKNIAKEVNRLWNNLFVIVIKVPHREGQLGKINPFFSDINIENQMTRASAKGRVSQMIGNTASIVIRLDSNDQPGLAGKDFTEVWSKVQNSIYKYLDADEKLNPNDWIQTFANNEEYERFLKAGG